MHELVAKEIQNHHPETFAVEEEKFSKWQTDSKLFLPGIDINKSRCFLHCTWLSVLSLSLSLSLSLICYLMKQHTLTDYQIK